MAGDQQHLARYVHIQCHVYIICTKPTDISLNILAGFHVRGGGGGQGGSFPP